MRRRLITYDQATTSTHQHQQPCSDCPWHRESLPGWLGSLTPDQWIRDVHGEVLILCHAVIGPECAGAAIYRANVGKRPRDPKRLMLPPDRATVFATPLEFRQHHEDNRDQTLQSRISLPEPE